MVRADDGSPDAGLLNQLTPTKLSGWLAAVYFGTKIATEALGERAY